MDVSLPLIFYLVGVARIKQAYTQKLQSTARIRNQQIMVSNLTDSSSSWVSVRSGPKVYLRIAGFDLGL